MSHPANFSTEDHKKIDAKLGDLELNTGLHWSYEITHQLQHDSICLLEITVNGRILRPVILDEDAEKSADRICSELDRCCEEMKRRAAAGTG
jgi:hypothetical protein